MTQDPSYLRPRNLLLGIGALLIGAVIYYNASEDAQRATELRAAEIAGEVAARVIASNSYEMDWLRYRIRDTDAALAAQP